MNARGERILIFGDSLTQHSSGANPIWNVDQGPQRTHHAPGDLLASLLLDQGAEAVRTNALVGRSAFNFWTREPAQNLIAADLAWRPTKIVFVLGTNDIGLAPGPDADAFVRLRNAYKPARAELWAIGPFVSGKPAAGIATVAQTMRQVFGSRFIDGRTLSTMISPGSDGLHYSEASARLLALNMADALLSASPVKPWMGLAIGAAIVVGGGLIYSLAVSRGRELHGAQYSKFHVRLHGYPLSVRKEPHGQYEIFQRPNDFMIRYVPAIGDDLTKIEPGSKLGVFRELDAARRAIDEHHATRARNLSGLEIVDGRKHTGTVNELIRSGYRQIPCKSGLDAKGLARCWSRGRTLGDPDDPQPGEDDGAWWQRLQHKANAGRERMQRALEKHDALILTTTQGRRVLVIKTPEVADVRDGSIRVTTFDEDGPIGHTTRHDLAQLAEEVHRDWYPTTIEPATEAEIMAWTGTERFARGAAAVAEVQRHNRKGLGLPPHEREALAQVILDYKDVARRRGYDDKARAFGTCDTATRDFLERAHKAGVSLMSYKFDLTKERDLKRLQKAYNLDAKTMTALRDEAARSRDRDCMFHEIAVDADGLAIDWTANQFKKLPTPFVFRLTGIKPKPPKRLEPPAEVPRPMYAPRVTRLPPGAAQIVEGAARAVPRQHRFGEHKVFISDVHAQLVERGVNISLDDLKRELVRMLPQGNVLLARADLVAAMDPQRVAASEISDKGAEFHFVLLPD